MDNLHVTGFVGHLIGFVASPAFNLLILVFHSDISLINVFFLLYIQLLPLLSLLQKF